MTINNNSKLTINDYKNILIYYKKPIPKTLSKLKSQALNIIANKLCKCIKKVDKNSTNERRAIAICTKNVVNKKGFNRGIFNCTKKANIILTKPLKAKKNKTRKL